MEWIITIEATITKEMRVEAETEDAAIEKAQQEFDVAPDDTPERYTQDVLNVTPA